MSELSPQTYRNSPRILNIRPHYTLIVENAEAVDSTVEPTTEAITEITE